LDPGIYYLDQGSFTVNGGATITGTGVTLVFTSSTGSNYATANINGGATVSLTAPTSGPLAGIAFYGDPNMPVGKVGGSGTISALSVSVTGGVSGASSITTTQGVATGQLPIKDPYAGTYLPPFSGCDQHN
jgi:hypothetical protein